MGEHTPRFFDPDDPNWIDYERPIDVCGCSHTETQHTRRHPENRPGICGTWRCSCPGYHRV